MIINIGEMILKNKSKLNLYSDSEIDLMPFSDFYERNKVLLKKNIKNVYNILNNVISENYTYEINKNFGRNQYHSSKNGEFIIMIKGEGYINNFRVKMGEVYYVESLKSFEIEGAIEYSRVPI